MSIITILGYIVKLLASSLLFFMGRYVLASACVGILSLDGIRREDIETLPKEKADKALGQIGVIQFAGWATIGIAWVAIWWVV